VSRRSGRRGDEQNGRAEDAVEKLAVGNLASGGKNERCRQGSAIAEKSQRVEASWAVFHKTPGPGPEPGKVYADCTSVLQSEVEAFIEGPESGGYSFAGGIMFTREGNFVGVAPVHSDDPGAVNPFLLMERDRMIRHHEEHCRGGIELKKSEGQNGNGRNSEGNAQSGGGNFHL
jgi:hypothetical protein